MINRIYNVPLAGEQRRKIHVAIETLEFMDRKDLYHYDGKQQTFQGEEISL